MAKLGMTLEIVGVMTQDPMITHPEITTTIKVPGVQLAIIQILQAETTGVMMMDLVTTADSTLEQMLEEIMFVLLAQR